MKGYIFNQLRDVPVLVKKEIYKENIPLKRRPAFLKLKKYADDFESGKSMERWIVLTGLRGVGKTTVLYQIYDYLVNGKKIPSENVFYVSIDHMKTFPDSDLYTLIDTFVREVHDTSIVRLDKKLYLLIDESHFDKEWDDKIKPIWDRTKNIFFVNTGSSALSLNLSVDASRRLKKEFMAPLNLSDYLMLKYSLFFPPRDTAKTMREVIFYGLSKVEDAKRLEKKLKINLSKLPNPVNKELDLFLKSGGFGFSLDSDFLTITKKTNDLIDKIIKDDLPLIKEIKNPTQQLTYRLLGYLATKKPGEMSREKLSNSLRTSPDVVSYLLEALEKTEIILSIKPFSSEPNKKTKSPWKYYFSTPTIQNVLYRLVGGDESSEYLGVLWECSVGSTLYRMQKTLVTPKVNVFYDPGKQGVDFILQDILQQKKIPIEVGSGDKGFNQIRKAISKYKSGHGILITDCESIEVIDNIIKIPLSTFLFA